MLDVVLTHKNLCYSFKLARDIRLVMYGLRKSPKEFVPRRADITVNRPIVKMFEGAVKSMPVCFGKYVSETKHSDTTRLNVGVVLNYYSKLILNDNMYIPENLFLSTPLGKCAVASVISSGINMVMVIGNDTPTLLDLRMYNKEAITAINEAQHQSILYLQQYGNKRKREVINPGIQCTMCSRKEECI